MLNFYRYSLRYEFKKITTWLLPIVGILLYIVSAYLTINSRFIETNNISFIETGNTTTFIIVFAVSTIFIGLKSISIFGRTRDSGEEIIFATKPTKRIWIILSKFLSLWTLMLFISLAFFFVSLIVGSLDNLASQSKKANYSGSILLGNLIIMLIVSSVIVIFALHLPHKAVILLTIIISSVFPLISLIMTTTMRAGLTKENQFQSYIKAPSSIQKIGETNEVKIGFTNSEVIYVMSEKATPQIYKSLHQGKSDPYSKLAYLDIWEQLSGLYSLTYNNIYNSLSAKKWTENTYKYNVESDDASITLDGQKYGIWFQKNIVKNNGSFLKQENLRQLGIPNSPLLKLFDDLIKDPSYNFNGSSFVKQLIYVMKVSNEFTKPLQPNHKPTLSSINPITVTKDIDVAKYFEQVEPVHYLMWKYLSKIKSDFVPATKIGFTDESYTNFSNTHSVKFNISLVKDGSKIGTVSPGSYVNKVFLYTFWFLLASFLITLTVFTAYNKDYK